MEDKIKDFQNKCAEQYFVSTNKKSFNDIIYEAIQFGSELRAERVKEKIEAIPYPDQGFKSH